MRLDFVKEPISDSDPCGPDLDLEMDPDYSNYTLLAGGRMPARYFDNDGVPFDRTSIDLAAETKTITSLLERTRDTRLLALDIRFHALRGEVIGFTEGIIAMSELVSAYWEEFHPRPEDGDLIFRVNAIESIDDQVTVVLPLTFSPLVRGGRLSAVSLRQYLVATGKAEARGREETISSDEIARSMSAEERLEQLTTLHNALKATQAALASIRKVFFDHDAAAVAPSFSKLDQLLLDLLAFIATYRPELGAKVAVVDDFDEAQGEESGGAVVATTAGAPVRTGLIKSHDAARSALRATELYFLKNEPSSPALVLVRQARALVGKPLVVALEALVPGSVPYVVLRFDSGFKFDFAYDRIKFVTEELPQQMGEDLAAEAAEPEPEAIVAEAPAAEAGDGAEGAVENLPVPAALPEAPPKFSVKARGEATEMMVATEAFFRSVEPSSPIPMLLARARNLLNKDFASLLAELIPS